jgi:hypothetical protein
MHRGAGARVGAAASRENRQAPHSRLRGRGGELHAARHQRLTLRGERIEHNIAFLTPEAVAHFGLPDVLQP